MNRTIPGRITTACVAQGLAARTDHCLHVCPPGASQRSAPVLRAPHDAAVIAADDMPIASICKSRCQIMAQLRPNFDVTGSRVNVCDQLVLRIHTSELQPPYDSWPRGYLPPELAKDGNFHDESLWLDATNSKRSRGQLRTCLPDNSRTTPFRLPNRLGAVNQSVFRTIAG